MTVIQRLNDAFATEIMTKEFPVKNLSMRWKVAAISALEFASPHSLGINAEIFKKLALMHPSHNYSLTLFEFATLSNNLEARSAKDLNMTMNTYVDLVLEANEHVKYYDATIKKIRQEVQDKITAEVAAEKSEQTEEQQQNFGGLKAEA